VVWQEVCRHIEIGESTATIAKILAKQMPVAQIIVRRIDSQRSVLETVACASSIGENTLPATRTACSPGQIKELLDWSRSGAVVQRFHYDAPDMPWAILVPSGVDGDVLVGPLTDHNGQPSGVLLLIAVGEQVFAADHVTMMKMLLEPFSTALENDRRLREMTATKAAAEADKHSLLTRLGRKEIADSVVGADSGLRSVMERAELVARSDVPVLILGETGTGKEVVARLIHNRSSRAGGPFLRINCGAIPLELIDSQLFGHEKGAFTGAVETRQGWFERADGGTLLLDELGELPLAAQVRLLRILQDGWLERVGGHEPIHVDVRIVAATHRDLAAMVAEKKFREDLWYRIAVFPMYLPPLRERIGDIPELARHFAERAATRLVLPLAMPSPEDIQLLTSYPWPGNIRELASVIERAAILGNGKGLEMAKSLGVSTGSSEASSCGISSPANTAPRTTNPGILSLDEAMKRHIEIALAATRGLIEGRRGTAALLKINPHTLRARMRKLGIDWARYREDNDN
jgi:transcriptional regulator with GAF, ATPase, and Fis domain